MQVYFIVNPKSGKGLKVFRKFQKKLTISYHVYQTEYPKHATALTEQIKRQDPKALVVAVGGDGTINEIVNGAVNSKLTIGVISSGSGNDFARSFYSFKTPEDIERFLSERTVGQADIGKMSTDQGERYFINNSGLGFDALICHRVRHSKVKQLLNRINLGKLVYVYHVLLALIHFKPFQLKLETEEGVEKVFEKVWFVVASNQPYFGGGMKISPYSNTKDGKLEYTIVHQIGKLHFVILFWKVFKGRHLVYKQYVEQFQGKSSSVQAEKLLFGHVDGEVFPVQAQDRLNFSVNQGQLKHVVDNVSFQKEYDKCVEIS